MEGFAILCVTIPPRGQVALRGSDLALLLDFYTLHIISTSMKADNKIVQSGPRVAQESILWIGFNDKAIDKLFIKSGNRVTVKFKNVKVPYLNGLILRYSPLTQKKRFYSKYKYKDKTKRLKLNEFILDHYGTLEVSEELLKLYKKYYPSIPSLKILQFYSADLP